MAENKKSFLLYCDLIHTVSKMPKDKAGELFIHILEYVNDKNPVTDDLIIQLTFEPIKQSLKRDLQKYESIRNRNSENAKLRWDKKNATASDRIPNDTKNADSVNDSVNDSDTINNNTSLRSEQFDKFWEFYGKHGAKKPAKQRFMKLTETEMEALRKHLPKYLDSTPDIKFRKHAERYLSSKLWENGDIKKLSQPVEYWTNPFDYWNRDLTPEEWKRVPPDRVEGKKDNDIKRRMGI